MRQRWPGWCHRKPGRAKCLWDQDTALAVERVGHLQEARSGGRTEGEFLRDLPVILDEESVTPLGDGALDLGIRRGES